MTVHPLAIVFHRGGVYFVVQTADQRRFSLALDRMSNLRLMSEEERFPYPADFDADAFFEAAWGIDLREPLYAVALRLAPFITAFVRERSWGRNESYELHPDGSATMRFSAKGEVELLEWIGGMGAEVEVLEPPELRAKMRERLRTALAAYEREG